MFHHEDGPRQEESLYICMKFYFSKAYIKDVHFP